MKKHSVADYSGIYQFTTYVPFADNLWHMALKMYDVGVHKSEKL